jgi:hypothetical protein
MTMSQRTHASRFSLADELLSLLSLGSWYHVEDLIDNERWICYRIWQPGPHDQTGVPMVNAQDVLNGAVNTEAVAPNENEGFNCLEQLG